MFTPTGSAQTFTVPYDKADDAKGDEVAVVKP